MLGWLHHKVFPVTGSEADTQPKGTRRGTSLDQEVPIFEVTRGWQPALQCRFRLFAPAYITPVVAAYKSAQRLSSVVFGAESAWRAHGRQEELVVYLRAQ